MKIDRRKPFQLTFNAAPVGGRPLEMPRTIPVWVRLISTGALLIFGAVWWSTYNQMHLELSGDVTRLMGSMFMLFWLLGWSMGVLFIAALTVFLFLFRESGYLSDGRLIGMLTVGPAALRFEYELARMRDLRVENDANGKTAKIHFDYDGVGCSFGNMMKPDVAERNLLLLQNAVDGVAPSVGQEFAAPPAHAASQRDISHTPTERRRMPLISTLALLGANLLPLLGVIRGEWSLADVMVLFWAESAIIAFYTLLKIGMVAKWWSPFPGLFFLSHFGGFMAIHFMFIHGLFVRGIDAKGAEPGAVEVFMTLATDLRPALLALIASHGVSFVMNFIVQREYEFAKLGDLMRAPYDRVLLMHFAIILGGGMVMMLHSPVPAVVLLIVLKVAADLRAHFAERNPKQRGDTRLSEAVSQKV